MAQPNPMSSIFMKKTQIFENLAQEYDKWFDENKIAYESEVLALRKSVPQNREGLEIGVGTGRFAVPLGIRFGVEPSKAMGEIARKRGIEVIAGVAESLPFKNCQFDVTLMVTTICFLNEIETSLKEAYRVVKPRGFFIIGFIDRNSLLGKAYQKHKAKNIFYKDAIFYSVDEVVFYLKKAGFAEFDFRQTIFSDLREIKNIELPKEGYGEGSFVVVRGMKTV